MIENANQMRGISSRRHRRAPVWDRATATLPARNFAALLFAWHLVCPGCAVTSADPVTEIDILTIPEDKRGPRKSATLPFRELDHLLQRLDESTLPGYVRNQHALYPLWACYLHHSTGLAFAVVPCGGCLADEVLPATADAWLAAGRAGHLEMQAELTIHALTD
jgi:hypothetical protein